MNAKKASSNVNIMFLVAIKKETTCAWCIYKVNSRKTNMVDAFLS